MKKMISGRLTSFLLVFIGIFSGRALAVDMAPYHHLVAGRDVVTLDFSNDGTGLAPDNLVMESLEAIGDSRLEVFHYSLLSGPLDPQQIYELQSDGHHYLVSRYDREHKCWIDFDPPLGPIDGNMSVGQTIDFDYTEIGCGKISTRSVKLMLVAVGFPYSTPAGRFNDCALMMMRHYDSGGLAATTSFNLLAKGIGEILRIGFDAQGVPQDENVLVYIISMPPYR